MATPAQIYRAHMESGAGNFGISVDDRRMQESDGLGSYGDSMDSEASDFSWGAGITPPGGSRYHGTTPEPDVVVNVVSDRRM